MIYFKFNNTSNKNENPSNPTFKNRLLYCVIKHLFWFIPKTNPDFDSSYENVRTWYIEYDDVNDYTNREVGIDFNGKVIVKGPYQRNLGFWTSEDTTYRQFVLEFDISHIKKEEFEIMWNRSS